MFCVIGNSPSSGSTLLSDLLDSTDYGVCGPELNILSNTNLYKDFQKYSAAPFLPSASSSLYKVMNSINTSRLFNYALDEQEFMSLLHETDSAYDFLIRFGLRFSQFRGKDKAVWFEKTPENINCAQLFLDSFPEAYFIHIVRNPIHVARSLLHNRHFPLAISLFAWLFDVSHLSGVRSDKLITVYYEDLVHGPYEVVSKILSTITGETICPEVVREGYEKNYYRKSVSKKIKTWGISEYGLIGNANKKIDDVAFLSDFKSALNYRISDCWHEKYSVPSLSYWDAIKEHGYEEDVLQMLNGVYSTHSIELTYGDRIILIKKNLKEIYLNHKYNICLNPFVFLDSDGEY